MKRRIEDLHAWLRAEGIEITTTGVELTQDEKLADLDLERCAGDLERARDLFERRYYVDPDSSIIGDAVNHSAIQLLKDDPEEYFRLARIWRSVGDA